MLDVQKYKAAMLKASSRDPMRADYPPDWDADGIEEDWVERRSKELYDTIIASPEDMTEMLREFSGDEAGQLMFVFCKNLANLLESVVSLAPVARNVKLSLREIIEEYADQQAKKEIEDA